eukprot:4363589-Amphidinium_carterae.1
MPCEGAGADPVITASSFASMGALASSLGNADLAARVWTPFGLAANEVRTCKRQGNVDLHFQLPVLFMFVLVFAIQRPPVGSSI